MQLRKSKRGKGEVESSALNDILFILLFFFLIVATLANPNVIKVANPRADSHDRAKQTVIVSIDAHQKFYVGTKPTDPKSLKPTIVDILNERSDATPTIVINADKQATAKNIVAIMRIANKLKVKTVLSVSNKKE